MSKHPIVDVAQHCLQFVRTYGIRTSLRESIPYIRELVLGEEERAENLESFDAQFGTDTRSIVEPWELPSLAPHCNLEVNGYQPTLASLIEEALSQIDFEPGRFTFVDMGSGKGRTLLVASQFPFKQIVGVEIAPELHDIASRNIELYKPYSQQCRNFDLQLKNVDDYVLPCEPLVVFLFNPFGRKTMTQLIEKLERSLSQAPRRAFVIYVEPRFESLWLKSSVIHTRFRACNYSIYEVHVPDITGGVI